jgi:hypothetical protein
VLGKNEQQPVIPAYSLVNLLVNLLAALQVVDIKPAAYTVVL